MHFLKLFPQTTSPRCTFSHKRMRCAMHGSLFGFLVFGGEQMLLCCVACMIAFCFPPTKHHFFVFQTISKYRPRVVQTCKKHRDWRQKKFARYPQRLWFFLLKKDMFLEFGSTNCQPWLTTDCHTEFFLLFAQGRIHVQLCPKKPSHSAILCPQILAVATNAMQWTLTLG